MKLIVCFAALSALSLSAMAQSTYRPLETIDEARERRSAENYNTYRDNRRQAPLGGYNEPLGSPSPRGTERPGYSPPYNSSGNRFDNRIDRASGSRRW